MYKNSGPFVDRRVTVHFCSHFWALHVAVIPVLLFLLTQV